ncbi:MAG: alpha/beta hydrolase [Pseudomonadota bacterium]
MADPLVFLPGMMCDARLFQPQIAAFSGQRAVHVAPLLGDSIEDIAARVIADAPPRFALAGLSMGGIVAMEILRQAPDMVTRVAFLDTNPKAELPDVAAAREPQIALVKAGRLEDVMRDEMKPRYLAPGPKRLEVLNIVMDMAKDLGPDLFVSQSRALMRRPDSVDTLKALNVPALVLCGSHDTVCPVSRHEFMAELIANATLEIIEDAGHLPTLEKPDETNAALDRWLHDRLLLS